MTPEPKPMQRLVRSLLVLVAVCVLGLIAGIVLVSLENADTNRRLATLEEYVQGRGEFRDREAARMEAEWQERFRRGQCELLDTFPADVPALERPRAKYGCGQGIPLSQLTPEEQSRLRARIPAEPAEPAQAPASPAPFSGGAVGPPATSTQTPPPPRATPSPTTPTPAPLLGPLTDTTCAVTGVCP